MDDGFRRRISGAIERAISAASVPGPPLPEKPGKKRRSAKRSDHEKVKRYKHYGFKNEWIARTLGISTGRLRSILSQLRRKRKQ
jgi:DNA invertase Pin-like site-specific DNA recombinase